MLTIGEIQYLGQTRMLIYAPLWQIVQKDVCLILAWAWPNHETPAKSSPWISFCLGRKTRFCASYSETVWPRASAAHDFGPNDNTSEIKRLVLMIYFKRTVVVALLADRSLPTPEIRSSHPDINMIFFKISQVNQVKMYFLQYSLHYRQYKNKGNTSRERHVFIRKIDFKTLLEVFRI